MRPNFSPPGRLPSTAPHRRRPVEEPPGSRLPYAQGIAHFFYVPAGGDDAIADLNAACVPAPIPLPAPVMNQTLLMPNPLLSLDSHECRRAD
jgi:hypothetical protein